jgi:hypothetical protein
MSTPEIWWFRKGVKPDFCLSEFSFYSEHPRILKAIYGTVIGTTYQKIGNLFCPVHISGLSHNVSKEQKEN